MTDKRSEISSATMRRLNEDRDFVAARDKAARERFTAENEELQRLANIAKRGCDVPAHQEAAWRELKQLKITAREAAHILGIPWLGDPEDASDVQWAAHSACKVADELIDLVETNRKVDPDFAYELIERAKRIKRVLTWNNDIAGGQHER